METEGDPEGKWMDAPTPGQIAEASHEPLPGAELASWTLMARRLREEVMGDDLFSEPAWDILLDLYAALDRGDRVQVTSIAAMAGIPSSTGRRWARKLMERGLLERERDRRDQRLTFVRLTTKGQEIMAAFMLRLARKGLPPPLPHQSGDVAGTCEESAAAQGPS